MKLTMCDDNAGRLIIKQSVADSADTTAAAPLVSAVELLTDDTV